MRISDWSSDVCSSDLGGNGPAREAEIIIISGNAFGAQIIAFAFFELRQRYGRIDVVKSDHAPAIILHHFSDRYAIGYIGPDDDSVSVADSRSEEHTSELQSLMHNSYAVFCLTTKTTINSRI